MTEHPGPDEATAQRAEVAYWERWLAHQALCGQYTAMETLNEIDRLRAENEQLRRDAADQLAREGQDMRLDEECTCTPPPSYEGPCAWCDVHGQPSVAWRQGLAEGRHNERVTAEMELKDAAKAYNHTAAALLRERDEARADRDRPEAPSIPLDALRALAQGEPLDEVSGDYGVPLDVVEQVAPWVGRKADLGAALDAIRSDLCVSAHLDELVRHAGEHGLYEATAEPVKITRLGPIDGLLTSPKRPENYDIAATTDVRAEAAKRLRAAYEACEGKHPSVDLAAVASWLDRGPSDRRDAVARALLGGED